MPFATGLQTAALAPVYAGQPRVLCCHKATRTGEFVPNSLPAIEDCVRNRVPRLEVDVRFLADDAMLVFHDSHLDHETTGSGRTDLLDSFAARDLRFRRDPSVRVAFLGEVVDLVRGSSTLLQVDLKLLRWMTPGRLYALTGILAPIRDQVLLGSQAHWNVRAIAEAGYRVALDPTLHWHYAPGAPPGFGPARLGVHGLWDDAPLAHILEVEAAEYVRSRVHDLVGMFPASEWMVDLGTIFHIESLGVHLGADLAARGIELAAWTLNDLGPRDSRAQMSRLFENGVTTLITDAPETLAGYLTGPDQRS